MALPAYSAAKHHVGLGPTGGADFGFLLEPGYQRNPQRDATPREFGGSRDLIDTSPVLSRWTQDDFSGGNYQETWGDDPAMFNDSLGVIPSLFGKSVLTVPPMLLWETPGAVNVRDSIAVFASGPYVQVVALEATRHFHWETGALTTSVTEANTVRVAAHDPTDNIIYSIAGPPDNSVFHLRTYGAGVAATTIGTFPASAPNLPRGLEMAGKDFLAAMSSTLYLCDVNDARTSTKFVRLGRLPGAWADSCAYNGIIYILVRDTEGRTSIYSWDGAQIAPVVVFPYNFVGLTIAEYGGRLYVGGSGKSIAGTERYAELHEVLSSSQRVILSLADQARSGQTVPTRIHDLCVHEGLLFAATDKPFLLAYDVTRDSLFGGPSFQFAFPSAVQPKRLLSTHEKLFTWCEDAAVVGAGGNDGFYRLATSDAELTGSQDSFVELSDFSPEPDREKRWSRVRILTRLADGTATEEPSLEVSVDGGVSWANFAGTHDTNGRFVTSDYDLTSVASSHAIRLRVTIAKDTIVYTELLAVTLSFLFLDSGKHSWSFTVAGAEKIEELDGGKLTQDVATLSATLWQWMNEKTLLDYTDLDGTVYKVNVTDLREHRPFIAPSLADGSREGYLPVTLTEV